MGRKIVLGLVAGVGAAASVFLVVVMVRQGLDRAGIWAVPLATLAGIVAAVAAVYGPVTGPSKVPLPPELEVPGWVIGRPVELAAIVKALLAGQHGTVGITTGLYGAGGFGKTTLARMVCADRRVRRWYGGRVYLVTVGRDVRGAAAVAAKVNEVIKLIFDEDATFTDPQLAGQRLGSLLDAGPRRLLVLDDVWEAEQLAPLAEGGRRCARLVTTRVPELLAGRGTAVLVDQMSPEQARALLTGGSPPLDEAVMRGLLSATGRWPLLLRLASKILADYARMASDVSAQGAVLVERLRAGGPAVVDDLLGETGRGLDVGQPQERARAVRATISASTSLLDPHDAERFTELGVFAEDETIPFGLVAQLWRTTAGLDDLQAAQVCNRLAQLALVSQAVDQARGLSLHDVVRDFLRAEIGWQRLAALNGTMLDAVAAGLPAAEPLDPAADRLVRTAWWEMRAEDRYLWDYLIEHLRDAGRPSEADTVAGDLRWVGARLERFGPAAPAADLAAAGTPRAARLRAVLAQAAHLLAPTEPTGAVVDVLHSRIADDPDWAPQVTALRDICGRSRLVNHWPLPDLPDPALRRVLVSHTGPIWAVAVAPDGSWLASAGEDCTVRIWDVATWRERAVLAGHTSPVLAVAVAPDGSWLASASSDETVRIWDADAWRERDVRARQIGPVLAVAVAPDCSWLASSGLGLTGGASIRRVWTAQIWDVATGRERAVIGGRTHTVWAMAPAPDGSWLASASSDATVRIWDAATGRRRAVLVGHTGPVNGVAVAPDGNWLASAGRDETVRIWDAATGRQRAVLVGHTGPVYGVAVAPDGNWLASAGRDETVRIWDAATGRQRAVLVGHTGPVYGVAVAPDGNWLASVGDDGTIRIWDASTVQERPVQVSHVGEAVAVAVAPDGSWLASASRIGTIRIWDATGQERAVLAGHTHTVWAMAVAPDGSWLASASSDETVRIWDAATGRQRAVLGGHAGPVLAVAVAPDGSWLASACWDAAVRIWDAATGRQRAVLAGHTDEVTAIAIAPDGSWLASASRDETIRIWDAATGRQRAVLAGHTDEVTAIAIAPDGSWLASASRDETVRIWDAATGRQRAVLAGHTDEVTAIAIAPDGSWLASASRDETVRIWDAATGRQRAVLAGHTDEVTAIAIAPDGSWLASAAKTGTVRIWDMPTGRVSALMRLDRNVYISAWLSLSVLAVGGSAGVYLFDFVTAPARQSSNTGKPTAGGSAQ